MKSAERLIQRATQNFNEEDIPFTKGLLLGLAVAVLVMVFTHLR